MLIGLFVNQVIKATSPLLSMMISYFVLQRRYAAKLIATVIVIAAGAMAAVPFKDPSVTPLGIGLVTIATLASSTKPVVGELLMSGGSKPKLAPAGALANPSSTPGVGVASAALGEAARGTDLPLLLRPPCAPAHLPAAPNPQDPPVHLSPLLLVQTPLLR